MPKDIVYEPIPSPLFDEIERTAAKLAFLIHRDRYSVLERDNGAFAQSIKLMVDVALEQPRMQ